MSTLLLSLSNELLIEIFSDLSPYDIYACRCACRRLNNLIVNSQLLQYISRTALSGVFDTLEPGIPLTDRLEALERWETSWMEMDVRKPIDSVDPFQDPLIDTLGEPPIDYIEQHVITFRMGFGVPASYSFLNLHTRPSSTLNVARWTTIEVNTHNVLTFAFAPGLNLSATFSYVKRLVTALTLFLILGTLLNPCGIECQP
jgi:F-box associated protein